MLRCLRVIHAQRIAVVSLVFVPATKLAIATVVTALLLPQSENLILEIHPYKFRAVNNLPYYLLVFGINN